MQHIYLSHSKPVRVTKKIPLKPPSSETVEELIIINVSTDYQLSSAAEP